MSTGSGSIDLYASSNNNDSGVFVSFYREGVVSPPEIVIPLHLHLRSSHLRSSASSTVISKSCNISFRFPLSLLDLCPHFSASTTSVYYDGRSKSTNVNDRGTKEEKTGKEGKQKEKKRKGDKAELYRTTPRLLIAPGNLQTDLRLQ